jgi:hypothetical protein
MLRRIGHRGAFLILLGLSFILYGLGIYQWPDADRHVDLFLPYLNWAYIWIATGGFAILFAFSKRDKWAFAVTSLVSAWWALRWLHVWIVEHYSAALFPAGTWILISCIIVVVSTWPDYRKLKRK